MQNLRTLLSVAFLSLVVSACAGRKPAEDGETSVQVADAMSSEVSTGTASPSGLTDEESTTTLGLEDSTSGSGLDSATMELINTRIVYFDYDSSILTPENESLVTAHARHLNSLADVDVILEGHADARGTREYNLALGENRAKAVANLMLVLGVSPDRIETVSYGEERPVSIGSGEEVWSLNRRVEILYQ